MTVRIAPRTPPRLQTVGQAEEWGYRVLVVAAALLAIGLVMTVALVFVFVGIPLLIIGTLLAWADFIWVLRVSRRPVHQAICKLCGKPNRAFLDAGPVPCEECGAMLAEPPSTD